jgi:hypothetical protein
MPNRQKPLLESDALALWYFRLNGVFSIPNFILHPECRGSARTDSDIAGVRFPYRSEFPPGDGGDDEWFAGHGERACAVLAEVKTSICAINGPWSDRSRGNVNKVLNDLGWYDSAEVPTAASDLYQDGFYDGPTLRCSLFCVGDVRSSKVSEQYPRVPQRTWSEIIAWIHRRFERYERRKKDHNQWDAAGQAIWRHFDDTQSLKTFESAVRRQFLLPAKD